jgi:ABC-type nitrate/sulfonate/bicarbonate transport system permease component
MTAEQTSTLTPTPKAGPATKRRRAYVELTIFSLVAGVTAWWLVVALGLANPVLLPPPDTVVRAIVAMVAEGTLFRHVLVSLARAVGGFLLATAIGVPLGILLGRSARAFAIVDPWVELLRPVPPIAVLPLVVLWFGIGEESKLVVVFYGAIFPILINTIHGVRSVDNTRIRAARALGATERQIFYLVVLPAAVPSIVTGLRLGAGMAIFVLVAAELLGSTAGLGWLIMDSREHFFTDRIMVGIVALGLMGYLINRSLLGLERRLVRWRPARWYTEPASAPRCGWWFLHHHRTVGRSLFLVALSSHGCSRGQRPARPPRRPAPPPLGLIPCLGGN